ncbi:DUF7683 domain-containing protein [Pseudomonas sp. OV226]|uniref:DUF7683 domain-containing protein n=1 Tax=Pseudomonas sp. OV226 TaxID=2135588 RepID=UPI000D6B7965|nr:hypothetical protein [Pseudomonas sp. OV226]PWK29950.1 hypothetical protein C7534_1311 [Pseudomonas sp. OV226]
MKYLVEAFYKETDFQAFVVELPQDCDVQIKSIMGWTRNQQGWEGYNLSQLQLSAIEKIIGRPIYDSDHYFQLTCNG